MMKTNLFATLVCLIMGMSIPTLLSAADKAVPGETTVVIATGLG